MQMLSILVISLFIYAGCAHPELPSPPDVKDHFLVEIKNQNMTEEFLNAVVNIEEIPEMNDNELVRCLHFNIISFIPYKIKYSEQLELKECNLVGGYKPKDSLSIYNWLSDAEKKLEKYKHCFKE